MHQTGSDAAPGGAAAGPTCALVAAATPRCCCCCCCLPPRSAAASSADPLPPSSCSSSEFAMTARELAPIIAPGHAWGVWGVAGEVRVHVSSPPLAHPPHPTLSSHPPIPPPLPRAPPTRDAGGQRQAKRREQRASGKGDANQVVACSPPHVLADGAQRGAAQRQHVQHLCAWVWVCVWVCACVGAWVGVWGRARGREAARRGGETPALQQPTQPCAAPTQPSRPHTHAHLRQPVPQQHHVCHL